MPNVIAAGQHAQELWGNLQALVRVTSSKVVELKKGVTNTGSPTIATPGRMQAGCLQSTGSTGQRAIIAHDSSYDIGSDNFTLEGWLRYDATPSASVGGGLVSKGWNLNTGPFLFYFSQGIGQQGKIYFYASTNNSTWNVASALNVNNGETITVGTWYHFAAVRHGTNVYTYWNGKRVSTATSVPTTALYANSSSLILGSETASTYGQVSIEEFAIWNFARYTEAFYEIPTRYSLPRTQVGNGDPHLNNVVLALPMNGTNASTTFTDLSAYHHPVTANGSAQITTSQFKFGAASGSFSGTYNATTGQSALIVPHHPTFDFGSGDFTIEGFVRLNELTTVSSIAHGIICKRATTAVYAPFNIEFIYTAGPTTIRGQASTSGSSWITCQGATSISADTWYHVALTRSGSDLRLFLNGTQEGTTQTVSGALMTNSDDVSIGAASEDRDYGLLGFIDDLRVTKGHARYTSNFTAPKNPFDMRSIVGYWNPEYKDADITLSNNNATASITANNGLVRSIDGYSTGSRQFEVTMTVDALHLFGLVNASAALTGYPGTDVNGWSYYGNDGNKYNNSSASTFGPAYAAGDVMGCVWYADAGDIAFYKNGVFAGLAFTGVSGTLYAAWGPGTAGGGPRLATLIPKALTHQVAGTTDWAGINTRTSVAAWNASDKDADVSVFAGNTVARTSSGNAMIRGTTGSTSGFYQCEFIVKGDNNHLVGLAKSTASLATFPGNDADGYTWYGFDGTKYNNGSTAYSSSFAVDDVIGVVYDIVAGSITFYKNGVSQGTAFTSDPHWASVVSLLHFNGTNGSTTFTDEVARTWTASGNAQLSTLQTKFGPSSLLMDGTLDYIYTTNTADFRFGTGDYTVEGWARPANITGFMHFWHSADYDVDQLTVRMSDTGKLQAFFDGGANALGILTSTNSFTATTWSHWAVSRISGVTKIFIDGVEGASSSASYDVTGSTGNVIIGARDDTSLYMMNGYLDAIRVTKGVGRYSANFTPVQPLAGGAFGTLYPAWGPGSTLGTRYCYLNTGSLPFKYLSPSSDSYWSSVTSLLHFEGTHGSTTFTDQIGNTWSIRSGSPTISTTAARFGGSSLRVSTASIQLAHAASTDFGTGNFTLEGWFRADSVAPASQILIGKQYYNDIAIQLRLTTSTLEGVVRDNTAGGAGTVFTISGGTVTVDTWFHAALVRDGTTLRLFLNGTQTASTTIGTISLSPRIENTPPLTVGRLWAGISDEYPFTGYADEVRVTKGIARYTASFAVPTIAFPNQ